MVNRDYTKVVNAKNLTTGDACIIPYGDYNYYETERRLVYDVSIGECRLLQQIYDCLSNGHECLISLGYKG